MPELVTPELTLVRVADKEALNEYATARTTVEFGELFSTPSAAYPPRAAGFSGQYAPTVVMSGGCLPISGSRMIGGRRADAE